MSKSLYSIFLVLSFIWIRSSYGKISGGGFVNSLGKTLEKFATLNPYPFYKSFLLNFAIPNSGIFGLLTMYGELFAGVGTLLTSLYLLFIGKSNLVKLILILSLGVGAFLSLTFWLASGWTSPSTDGLNLLMFFIEIIGIVTLVRLQKP